MKKASKLVETMKFKEQHTDKEYLENLTAVAKKLKKTTLTQSDYNNCSISITTSMTFKRRFGKWNNALEKAGLSVSKEMDIAPEKLMLNLSKVANILGTLNFSKDDLVKPNSTYSISAYRKVYGNWTNARKAFEEYLNAKSKKSNTKDVSKVDYTDKRNHDTPKKVSNSLSVTMKEKYKYVCSIKGCKCGEAIGNRGKAYFKKLYVVHIKPWEEGGETVQKNLTVLCEKHYKESLKKLSNKSVSKTEKTPTRSRRIDPKVKEAVLRRDKHRCVFCGEGPFEKGAKYCKKIVIDHIKPFSKGGTNDLKNLQVLCQKHNLEKMAKEFK
jgi:5-methylcytosine-specific restriction endonuclease McrA